ncbi:glycerophosphodiester phosphodiesterase [Paenibacillus sp. GP183]|uniref:glycerophosphodiester phosphodiesterase n=1 Tax=Paenibacillus sp. GP183 TaxID=1882751 RepID=UPI00089871FA|nr:glycerophosphodiester phosphodiesterase [Paenibacillus sp. GP183]SEC74402.1 glycerophosphoryl diester phosphodiesterase [Paenibacillus sp. GP183]
MEQRRPMIIGHRGAKGEAPENTLASFQMALLQEAQGIELDVHLTKNGDIAVCHDETIDRTTDGSGFIHEMTTSEMKSFDAGSWFSSSFQGQQIPLLGEVFDLVPDSIMINVEIKASYDGKMEERLLDFLRERERLENVVISSFDHKCVRRVKQLEPDAKVGLLYSTNLIDHAEYAKMVGVEIYSLHPHYQSFDKADVDKAIAAELAVYCFTVNHIEDMRNMIRCGVSGIITDFPARLAQLLKQM